MNGVLVINKSRGPTSHDVVSQVRRILRIKKVGHTGTLDPAATGVLPLVLGHATKVARYLTGSDKTYAAVIRLGSTTTTLDAEGDVTGSAEVECSEDDIRSVVTSFQGEIDQLPPMYSAKKVEGKRLYQLARKGIEVEREAKRVTIHAINLIGVDGNDVQVEVRCSAGTYMRVLAHDVGEKLGCGAHLHALERIAAGPFKLEQSITVEDLEKTPELATKRLVPMDEALEGLLRINVPASIGRLVASGHQLNVADLRTLDLPDFHVDEPVTLGVSGGALIAVTRTLIARSDLEDARRDQRALKTERVFAQSR